MNLRVVKDSVNEIVPSGDGFNRNKSNGPASNGEPLDILIPVICLSVVVFVLIVLIMVCVVKNRSKAAANANTTLDKSSADESVVSDVQRPFVPAGGTTKSHFGGGQWSQTVYPAAAGKLPCGDSGFDAAESTAMAAAGNQYEVPFAHLAGTGQFQQCGTGQFGQQFPHHQQQFLRPAALPVPHHQYTAVPTGQSSAGSAYSRNLQQFPYQSRQYHLSDYESQ